VLDAMEGDNDLARCGKRLDPGGGGSDRGGGSQIQLAEGRHPWSWRGPMVR
jgi:hypothetical protein